jgi:hypothetical protein
VARVLRWDDAGARGGCARRTAQPSAQAEREEWHVVEVNEVVCALYEAAGRSGFRWERPRHEAPEPGEGCYRFFASICPPDWQRKDMIELQLHMHPDGQDNTLSFAIPLWVEPHWDGFAVAAKAQNRLAEADEEEGYAGEVSIQYRVNDEGVPELEGVWVEITWEIDEWVTGERPLDFDWAFEDLEMRIRALGDLAKNPVRE